MIELTTYAKSLVSKKELKEIQIREGGCVEHMDVDKDLHMTGYSIMDKAEVYIKEELDSNWHWDDSRLSPHPQ